MNRIRLWFQHEWMRRSAWQCLLVPLSWLFQALTVLRRFAYARAWLTTQRLAIPVVVVGNIGVGGSGKTPLVIWLVEQLRAAGYVPGVISRGYGGSELGPFEVGPLSDPIEVGDEPVLIAARTEAPLFIGRDRVAAGQALLEAYPNCDIIVSDDGLQHQRLQREFEIVVIDEAAGFGNGRLLPAGPLRESATRLKSVDAIVLNRNKIDPASAPDPLADPMGMPQTPISMRLSGHVFYNVKDPARHALAADLRDQTLHAVAGIGRPQRFFDHLRALRLNISVHPFPDHHRFQPSDLAFAGDAPVLMTEKDAVKCKAFARDNWWSLAVSAEIDDRLMPQLLRKLRPTYGPQTA
jgi:tetraacyldisaccharide 4'-kinase